MLKLAIIGASTGQLPLCIKAREMGIETFCFAWEKGAICKDYVDHFFPISITEKDDIVDICRNVGVDGVVSNASDILAEVVAYISEKLQLQGNRFEVIQTIKNKYKTRNLSKKVPGLKNIRYVLYDGQNPNIYPCIVKPITGNSKQGVSFVKNSLDFDRALNYLKAATDSSAVIEEYIEGREVSVETISFEGNHYIIQITDKDNSGSPHFVELGHHQPSSLKQDVKDMIAMMIPNLLSVVGFENGAAHIELRINEKNEIFLIEINPRGGGDDISNKLVYLSTGYDYVKAMIEVALGIFKPSLIVNAAYSGIYYLCKQTEYLLPLFDKSKDKDWLIECDYAPGAVLVESDGNYHRNAHLVYCSDHKISIKDICE